MGTVKKITVFRSVQSNRDSLEWRFYCDGDKTFSFKIVNPSGQALEDRAYEGMGEIHVITPAQAKGEKKQALTNCALYSARTVLKKYGDTVPAGVEVVISA
jgi:hypothetical protein